VIINKKKVFIWITYVHKMNKSYLYYLSNKIQPVNSNFKKCRIYWFSFSHIPTEAKENRRQEE
jgi:hypothetical protein